MPRQQKVEVEWLEPSSLKEEQRIRLAGERECFKVTLEDKDVSVDQLSKIVARRMRVPYRRLVRCRGMTPSDDVLKPVEEFVILSWMSVFLDDIGVCKESCTDSWSVKWPTAICLPEGLLGLDAGDNVLIAYIKWERVVGVSCLQSILDSKDGKVLLEDHAATTYRASLVRLLLGKGEEEAELWESLEALLSHEIYTPTTADFLFAVVRGKIDVAKRLLTLGVDPNGELNGSKAIDAAWKCLHSCAANRDCINAVDFLRRLRDSVDGKSETKEACSFQKG